MAFRINSNLMAMNALRNLSSTSMNFKSSVERLSTGLRINSGGDDPAGLQISEGFRSQISGISQAERNSQDAINFSKTAEGALNEVSTLLRDGKALILANLNDATLSPSQKQANQDQLASIIASVDRIAQQTSFGQKKLLNGSAGISSSIVNKTKVEYASIGGQFGNLTTNTQITANGNFNTRVTTAAVKATVTGMAVPTPANAIGADGIITVNGVSFNVSASTTHAQLSNMINARSGDTGVTVDLDSGNYVFASTKAGTAANAITVTTDTANIGFATASVNSLSGGVNAVANFIFGATSVALTADTTDGRTFRDSYGNVFRLTEAGVAATDGANVNNVIAVNAGSASFQIGGNIGQTASLSLQNMGASALGLSGLDITTASGAQTAANALDLAVDGVSSSRGKIGNFIRNILESNVRSLAISKENIVATESAVRDTDVAEEMTNFTKIQILQQSGMSMLAQANQAPSQILSLLRGG